MPRGIAATRKILHGTRLCNCVQLNVQANLSPKFGGLKGSGFSAADILAVTVEILLHKTWTEMACQCSFVAITFLVFVLAGFFCN